MAAAISLVEALRASLFGLIGLCGIVLPVLLLTVLVLGRRHAWRYGLLFTGGAGAAYALVTARILPPGLLHGQGRIAAAIVLAAVAAAIWLTDRRDLTIDPSPAAAGVAVTVAGLAAALMTASCAGRVFLVAAMTGQFPAMAVYVGVKLVMLLFLTVLAAAVLGVLEQARWLDRHWEIVTVLTAAIFLLISLWGGFL